MNLLKLIKNNQILYLCLFAILILSGVLFSYQYLFQTYFAMDEWSFYREILKYGPFYHILSVGTVGLLTGGTRTLGVLAMDIYFYLFGLNITPWQITFLTLHLANILLLYKLLRKFKLSPFSAFLASFFFAIASAGQETLSWPGAGMQILGSTLFILITILLTIKFNESKKNALLILAIFCSYISFLWKPTGIVTPILIVSLIILFYKGLNLKRLLGLTAILGVSTFVLGLFRLLAADLNILNVLIKASFDVIYYPFISISHIFIPYRLMFRLSNGFIGFYYPIISKDSNVDTISHLIISDYLSTIISFFIIVGILFLFKRISQFDKKVLIFGLIVFFIQYIPISIFYPDRGGLSYLESRHMYTSIIGISVMLGVFFNYILTRLRSRTDRIRYLYLLFLLLIGFWFYKEMTVTRREVLAQAIDDIAIKKTWESLKSLKLPNSNKLVIFLTSDRSYYYPEYRLPFKIPAAHMLPLAFYGKPFIDRSALGELNYNNTYIDSNNKQFGYFTDLKSLIPLIKRGKININNVVGLHFIDGSYTFEIITDKTRKLIENEL